MDFAWPDAIVVPFHLSPYRDVLFPLLLVLMCLGLLAVQRARTKVRTDGEDSLRVWYPPREPAGGVPMDWRGREASLLDRLAQAPDDREAAFELGCILARTGRHTEAITTFRQLLAKYPTDVDALFNLGHVYFNLRLWPQTWEAWKSAKLSDPRAVDVYVNLRLLSRLIRAQQPGEESQSA